MRLVIALLTIICIMLAIFVFVNFEQDQQSKIEKFVDIGGWCWFNHPNVLYTEGYVFLGYVANTGEKHFTARVARIDPSLGSVLYKDLLDRVDDDHAAPAMDVLPDGRIIVTVSKHAGKVIRIAIFDPNNFNSNWSITDLNLSNTLLKGMLTYPSPAVLGDRIFIFFRDGNPSNSLWRFIYSDDMGQTWSKPQILLDPQGKAPGVYVIFTRVGNTVYFTASLAYGPVDKPKKNVYFFYLDNDGFYRADGTKIADMETPLNIDMIEKVFDSDREGLYGAWIYDVYPDDDGRPIIAFTAFEKVENRTYKHYYYTARWEGDTWIVRRIADGGELHPMIINEYLYSGGIWIMRSDPNKVILSRKCDNGWQIEIRDLTGNLQGLIREPKAPNEMNIHPLEVNGVIIWQSGYYREKNILVTPIFYTTHK
uniref:Exo-alpha-sialidase n=1 Tax=candidate division WOR-3 bacterium TaxID=2052148 RepID=A0A7V4E5I9_UNCW3